MKLNPLFKLSIVSGVAEAIKLHILRGDDTNARDDSSATPLILAAARGRAEAIRLLLDSGADPKLVDRNGMDALAHAIKHGCEESISLLRDAVARVVPDEQPLSGNSQNPDPQCEINIASPIACQASEVLSFDDEPLQQMLSDDWEAEKELVAPEGDKTVARAARQLHECIGRHKAFNRDEDWQDMDLYLPLRAAPLSVDDGAESIRGLLLVALREGEVSEAAVIHACLNPDESRNEDSERLLAIVVGELGASVAEWAALYRPHSFEPTIAEEHDLAEAVQFAEDLASGRNDPFRFYFKNIRGDLLNAEEEISLGREMEEAGREAMFALAQWPIGLSVIFDAANRVAKREADVGYFSSGQESPSEDERPSSLVTAFDTLEKEDEASSVSADSAFFLNTVACIERSKGDVRKVIESLEKLCLTRSFLSELGSRAESSEVGREFVSALNRQAKARDRMILANLRLALSIAKKYLWSGIPLDDLVQEANIGLMRAVERYDWRKGFRFSTYATWWIRQKVSRAITDSDKVVRAPAHIQETSRTVLRERTTVENHLGRPESEYETAQRIGMPISKTRLLLSVFDEVESLDAIDPETGLSGIDGLIDSITPDPSDVAEHSSLRATLLGLLGELDERSREIILLRFGLAGDEAQTLEEVGLRYSVTRERVRQIESKAMRKLSHRNKREILWPFIGDKHDPNANEDLSVFDSQSSDQTEPDQSPINAGGFLQAKADSTDNPEQFESSHLAILKSDLVEQALKLGLKVEDLRDDGGGDSLSWCLMNLRPR